MENKGNINKKRIKSFKKTKDRLHFPTASASDVLGSYTGTPAVNGAHGEVPDLYPTQDADDL